MEQHLVHSIHNSLSLGLYDNARFLAERLVAATPTQVCCWTQAVQATYRTEAWLCTHHTDTSCA